MTKTKRLLQDQDNIKKQELQDNICDECGAICENCTTYKPNTRTATCVICDSVFTITMNDSGIFLVNHRCI